MISFRFSFDFLAQSDEDCAYFCLEKVLSLKNIFG